MFVMSASVRNKIWHVHCWFSMNYIVNYCHGAVPVCHIFFFLSKVRVRRSRSVLNKGATVYVIPHKIWIKDNRHNLFFIDHLFQAFIIQVNCMSSLNKHLVTSQNGNNFIISLELASSSGVSSCTVDLFTDALWTLRYALLSSLFKWWTVSKWLANLRRFFASQRGQSRLVRAMVDIYTETDGGCTGFYRSFTRDVWIWFCGPEVLR